MASSNLLQFPASCTYARRRTPLTSREIEVVRLPYLDNEGVALVLGCSSATSKAHRRHINFKLGTEDRWSAFYTWREIAGEQIERAA